MRRSPEPESVPTISNTYGCTQVSLPFIIFVKIMNTKTDLIIEETHTDKVIEIVGWALLIVLIGFSIYAYTQMPDTIPTHFNLEGKPDDYGKKSTIFLLCGVAVGLFALFTFILKSPHHFDKYNYPVKVKPENQARLYALSARLMRVMLISIVIIFLLISVEIFLISMSKIESTGIWSVIVILLLALAPVVFYLRRALKLRKR